MSQLLGILNPRKRRRKATKRRRRVAAFHAPVKRRRRRRRNPGMGALLLNPGRRGGGGIFSTVKSAAPAVLGTTGGLIGVRWLSSWLSGMVGGGSPLVNVGLRAASSIGGYFLLRKFAPRAAMPFLVGGGVATLEAGVSAVAPSFGAAVGLSAIEPAGMAGAISDNNSIGSNLFGMGVIQPYGLGCDSGLGSTDHPPKSGGRRNDY